MMFSARHCGFVQTFAALPRGAGGRSGSGLISLLLLTGP